MYVRRLFAKLTNFIRHGHAEAEMNREVTAPGGASGRLETKPRKDFAMRTIRIGTVACTLAIVAAVSVAPSHAQPASQTPQAALTKEAGSISALESIMKRILSEVLRRRNGVERRNGRAGALRIEFIERSRDESLGIEWVFAADRRGVERVKWRAGR